MSYEITMFDKDAGVVRAIFTDGSLTSTQHIKVPQDGNGDYDTEELSSVLTNLEAQVLTNAPSNSEAVEALVVVKEPTPDCEECARSRRDMLLTITDWTQALDVALTQDQKDEAVTYRQALRDVTQQAGFPESVEWPTLSFIDQSKVNDILTMDLEDCGASS